MDPVTNSWCNFTYLGPREDIGDLPCRREIEDGVGVVRSYWKPTADELKQLARGGTLCLSIFGMEPIPPVSLGVIFSPEDVQAPESTIV